MTMSEKKEITVKVNASIKPSIFISLSTVLVKLNKFYNYNDIPEHIRKDPDPQYRVTELAEQIDELKDSSNDK